MKLWEKRKNFSHLQVLFGFSIFYVFCLYDNFSGVLYPVFLAGMLMLYQGLMKQAGRSIKKDSRLYMLAILLLGVSTFLTGNLIIIWCNKLAVWVLFGILLLHDGYEDQNWTVFRYVGGLWDLAMTTLAHLFAVFPELVKSRRARKEQAGAGEKKRNGKLIYVILGILVGVTLLCLILPLLISADEVFDQMLGGAFDWVVQVISQMILPTKLIFMTLKFLWGLMFFFAIYSAVKNRKPRRKKRISAPRSRFWRSRRWRLSVWSICCSAWFRFPTCSPVASPSRRNIPTQALPDRVSFSSFLSVR